MSYQYVMADDYFIQNSENYTPIIEGKVQFLVNFNDHQAPIFQSKKVENKNASLVGNYCIAESSIIVVYQIDPLFLCIMIWQKQFLVAQEKIQKVDYESLFDRENQLQVYLSQRNDIKQNIHLICDSIQSDNLCYVAPKQQLLFQFLDSKRKKMTEFIQNEPFRASRCNQNGERFDQETNIKFFEDYMSKDLLNAYRQSVPELIVHLETQKQNNKDPFQPEPQEKPKSKSQQQKLSQSEIKNLKAAKGSKTITFFMNKKQQ